MSKGFKAKIPKNLEKVMSIRFLASFWQMLEKAYAQDTSKTVGELMAEVEEAIANEGFNVHEVLNECRTVEFNTVN